MIYGYPNEETQTGEKPVYSYVSKVAYERERPELKHLSRGRKRKKTRFLKQWRAKQEEPKPGALVVSGVKDYIIYCQFQLNCLERQTIEGESPVSEKKDREIVSGVVRGT